MDLSKSLKLLESADSRSFEDARRAIITQIDAGFGIKQLVQYYSEHRSERALNLLVSIREPHDRILLDQLADIFPRQPLNTTILLGQLLQASDGPAKNGQQPAWVSKIAHHTLFRHVTNHIISSSRRSRYSRIVVEDIAVLLFICALIPACTVLPESILKVLAQTFITACEMLRQRMRSDAITGAAAPKDDEELVHFSHLHYAVREYFMILYGMYPNHFTAFLKEYFLDAPEERLKIYRAIVKPFLSLVRFHPNLLEQSKKKELDKERWVHRESHDFLDDCKRVMIGAIPIESTIGDGPPPEEDTSTVMSDVYRTLFPSKSSGTTSNDAWDSVLTAGVQRSQHSQQGDEDEGAESERDSAADKEVETALMERIDTPPGTRSNTPNQAEQQRTLEEPLLVLDGKRRRSGGKSEHGDGERGGGGEKGKRSLRQTIGSIGKMFTRSSARVQETFHEEVGTSVEMSDARRNSELEEAEDAMDAIDVDRMGTPHAESSAGSSTLISPVSIAAAAAAAVVAKNAEEARASARSLRGSMRARADSTPKAAAAVTPTTPAASEEDGHTGGGGGAAPFTLGPGSAGGGGGCGSSIGSGVSRSRSTSFLTTPTAAGAASAAKKETVVLRLATTLDHPSMEEEEEEGASGGRATETTERSESSSHDGLLRNDVVGGISESLPDNRFSVSSFFTRLNRQRFRSECPPAEDGSDAALDWAARQRRHFEGMMALDGTTMKRTSSCPVLVDVSSVMSVSGGALIAADGTGAGGAGDEAARAAAAAAKKRIVNMVETFPYLAIINEPCPEFFTRLESGLEEDHERNREQYMKASADFHAKLKELNMADRLPGKIYDDLGHILKGLPVEKQRDMLTARLSLVNQHLLYERSCRLLHANRNRRLFGRIKMQKVYEAELRMYREREVKEAEERQEMINAMMDYRKKLVTQKQLGVTKDHKANENLNKLNKDLDSMARRVAEAESVAKMAVAERDRLKEQSDAILRRAEDAEVDAKMAMEKFELARTEAAQVKVLEKRLKKTSDELTFAERRLREVTGAVSPDWTAEDRIRELEAGMEKSRSEVERMRREMETTAIRKEESDRALKTETSKTLEMRAKLDRFSRLLSEQKEAAEQKYLSLQAIVRKQEEYISDLYAVVEEAEEVRRKNSLPPSRKVSITTGRPSDDLSLSSPSLSDPPVRSPPRRLGLPDVYISDEPPMAFFLIDPLLKPGFGAGLGMAGAESEERLQQLQQSSAEQLATVCGFDEEEELVLPVDC